MKELLQQALDALTTAEDYICDIDTNHARSTASSCDAAIEALRAAIAQGESETYGWMRSGGGWVYSGEFAEQDAKTDAKKCGGTCKAFPVYTAPQVAGYVPLSDEDIDGIGSTYEPHSRRKFARLVERAVRGGGMTQSIEVKELPEVKASEVIIQPAKSGGWMAWYAQGSSAQAYWMQAYPAPDTTGIRDMYKCPYPLFPNREDAVTACEKALPSGGQCRIVKISL